jgi:hypothetical protein
MTRIGMTRAKAKPQAPRSSPPSSKSRANASRNEPFMRLSAADRANPAAAIADPDDPRAAVVARGQR